MDVKIVQFKDVDTDKWDRWVAQIGETTYLHTSSHLRYLAEYFNVRDHSSFACLTSDGRTPLAICPLITSTVKAESGEQKIIGEDGLGVPALAVLKASLRRRLLNKIFETYSAYVEKNKITHIKMVRNPLTIDFCEGKFSGYDRIFELERYNMIYHVVNMVVIDLGRSEEDLFRDVSKYQRRHIERAGKKNIKVKILNSESGEKAIKEHFARYQDSHFRSAGRMTRPQKTWDIMLQMIKDRNATLFVAYIGDAELSYLYCSQFMKACWGGSQVNNREFEKEYSPRHLLEWEAILYYKRQGYRFYDVGERYFGQSPLYSPSKKMITIGDFKERYGGMLLPKVYWTGYADIETLKHEVSDKLDLFIKKATVSLKPEQI